MKKRPILFKAPMVRALLDDSKTQTRRVMKPQPTYSGYSEVEATRQFNKMLEMGAIRCPYGKPGDRLWVRETWAHDADSLEQCRAAFEDAMGGGGYGPYYRATEYAPDTLQWRPSIHMPRWASRITLEIVSVRLERLQDISEADAIAEGIFRLEYGGQISYRDYSLNDEWAEVSPMLESPVNSYRTLWESINGAGSWDANPFVWVVEFKKVTP